MRTLWLCFHHVKYYRVLFFPKSRTHTFLKGYFGRGLERINVFSIHFHRKEDLSFECFEWRAQYFRERDRPRSPSKYTQRQKVGNASAPRKAKVNGGGKVAESPPGEKCGKQASVNQRQAGKRRGMLTLSSSRLSARGPAYRKQICQLSYAFQLPSEAPDSFWAKWLCDLIGSFFFCLLLLFFQVFNTMTSEAGAGRMTTLRWEFSGAMLPLHSGNVHIWFSG